MIRRPPRSTLSSSSAASDVYKRQEKGAHSLTVDNIKDVTQHFNKFMELKARVLLSLMSVKRHQATQIKEGSMELLSKARDDDDPWVQLISSLLATYPKDSVIQLHPDHDPTEKLLKSVASTVAAAAVDNLVPSVESVYLDPQIAPPLDGTHTHFVLKPAPELVDPFETTEPEVQSLTAQYSKDSSNLPVTPRAIPRAPSSQAGAAPRRSSAPIFKPAPMAGSKRTMVAIDFEEAMKEAESGNKRRRGNEDKPAVREEQKLAPAPQYHEPASAEAVSHAWVQEVQQPVLTPQMEHSIRQAFSGATNQLTDELRVHMTAFLSGDLSAAPIHTKTEEVVLNEEDKYVMEADGTQSLSHKERIIFEMNYETGTWRKLRRKLGRKTGPTGPTPGA
eukprot:TRINITY_DN27999_c0_g1_i2.p1 TRINITY_DN27999_c0_g1~~TRINITY_DN27999_c0_g1_i2.p1  ORF type:complete len:391 (+),score=98.06 TRINITY_DN27999_c0_g1_i2:124-1296(+)